MLVVQLHRPIKSRDNLSRLVALVIHLEITLDLLLLLAGEILLVLYMSRATEFCLHLFFKEFKLYFK